MDHIPKLFLLVGGSLILFMELKGHFRVAGARRMWVRTRGILEKFVYQYGTADAAYSYTVNGKSYQGKNLSVVAFRSAPVANQFRKPLVVQRNGAPPFVVGRDVDVFFDPKNPDDSALILDAPGSSPLTRIVAFGMLGMAAVLHFKMEWVSARSLKLFALVFGFAALILATFLRKLWRRTLAVKGAATTQGRITHGELRYHKGSKESSGGYTPHVEFEYEAFGARYTSAQLTSLPLFSLKRKAEAQRALDALLAEPEVTVFYLPKEPWDAFLEATKPFNLLPLLLMTITFCGVSLLLFFKG